MISLWDWIFTMSNEGIYYGCCDANDDHVFHGFIIWEHNLQDNSLWAFIKRLPWFLPWWYLSNNYTTIFFLCQALIILDFLIKQCQHKLGFRYCQRKLDFWYCQWKLSFWYCQWKLGFWYCQWELGFWYCQWNLGFWYC